MSLILRQPWTRQPQTWVRLSPQALDLRVLCVLIPGLGAVFPSGLRPFLIAPPSGLRAGPHGRHYEAHAGALAVDVDGTYELPITLLTVSRGDFTGIATDVSFAGTSDNHLYVGYQASNGAQLRARGTGMEDINAGMAVDSTRNIWTVYGATFASTTSRTLYVNGVNKGSGSTSVTTTGLFRAALGDYWRGAWGNQLGAPSPVGVVINRAFSDADHARFSTPESFWSLIAPRRIWVPVSAAGGSHSGALAESGSASDSATAAAAWLAAVAEPASAADPTAALLAMVAAASETGSAADSIDALRALLAGASDSGAAEDAAAALASLLAAVNEPGAAADAQDGSTGSGHSGATEEAASAADTATAIAALLAASSETVGVSAAAAAIAALLAAVAEAGSAADVADWVAGASHSGAVSEAGAIAEAAAAAAALVGAVHDTSIVDDLAAAIADYRAALAEATQPQDVVAAAGALCAIVWAATAELRTFVPPPETRTWVAPPYSVKDLS